MSRVKGRGNHSTELALVRLFRARRIRGWRRHYHIPGKPDFAFPQQRLAIFVDGCFWHGCPQCYGAPKSNSDFWRTKLQANRARDAQVNSELRRRGWRVLRLWEHQMKKVLYIEKLVQRRLNEKTPGSR